MGPARPAEMRSRPPPRGSPPHRSSPPPNGGRATPSGAPPLPPRRSPPPRATAGRPVPPRPLLAQRLDGLHAAKVGAGGDPCDLEPRQEAGQSGRLAATFLVERPQPVVALPFAPVACTGMSDDEQRHCA